MAIGALLNRDAIVASETLALYNWCEAIEILFGIDVNALTPNPSPTPSTERSSSRDDFETQFTPKSQTSRDE
jgi:hypothetical protein